jgi:hypothetical protein
MLIISDGYIWFPPKSKILEILESGFIQTGSHCQEQMREREFLMPDILRVLQTGAIKPGSAAGDAFLTYQTPLPKQPKPPKPRLHVLADTQKQYSCVRECPLPQSPRGFIIIMLAISLKT